MRPLFCLTVWIFALVLAACGTQGGRSTLSGSEGWVSSGGELFRNRENPWWLRNVAEVRYCLLRDAATFTPSVAQAKEAIEEAIRYWKLQVDSLGRGFMSTELATLSVSSGGRGHVLNGTDIGRNPLGVAAQRFIESDCARADVRFLFGDGVLTAEERRYLGGTERHFAAAVRTQYDPVALRGKGFIYVAGDRGALRPGGRDARWSWRKPWRLLAVVAHELGHVFGFRHSVTRWSLMADRFPEWAVEMGEESGDVAATSANLPATLMSPRAFALSHDDAGKEAVRALGGVPPERPGWNLEFRPAMGETRRLDVVVHFPVGKETTDLGTIQELDLMSTVEWTVSVEATAEQRVFTDESGFIGGSVFEGLSVVAHAAGGAVFKPARRGAAEIPVHVYLAGRAGNWDLRLSAIRGNRLRRVMDLSFPLW